MRVSIEGHLAEQEARTFVNIQAQAVPRLDHVVHVHFRVAMLSIKNFKEEREIVRARGAQSKIFDRSDLLFESSLQFLFLERLLAAKFDDAGLPRAFFLLLHDRTPRFLSLFWPHDIDALRSDSKTQSHAAQHTQNPVSHVRQNESDISASLENRRELRHRQRG